MLCATPTGLFDVIQFLFLPIWNPYGVAGCDTNPFSTDMEPLRGSMRKGSPI